MSTGIVDGLHVHPPEIRHVEIVPAMQRPRDLELRASDGPQIHAGQTPPRFAVTCFPATVADQGRLSRHGD